MLFPAIVSALLAAVPAASVREYSEPTFSHYSIENGLSQTTVHSIAEDSDGFIWFVTDDGLNRYDGFSTRLFYHTPSAPYSFPDDGNVSVFTDSTGVLWLRTVRTTYRYDRQAENFREVPSSLAGLRAVCDLTGSGFESGGGGFLFLSDSAVLRADPYEGSIDTLYDCPGVKGALVARNRLFAVDSGDNLLCAGEGADSLSTVCGLSSFRLMKTAPDGSLWVNDNSGLKHFSTDNSLLRVFTSKDGLLSDSLTDISFDDKGDVWAGSKYGLNIIDSATGVVRNVDSRTGSSHDSFGYWVRCLFSDSNGGMWVGTHYYGADYYNPFRQSFTTFDIGGGRPDSKGLVVSSITPDSSGGLWVGTNLSGDFRLDRHSGSILQAMRSGHRPGPLEDAACVAGKTVLGYSNEGLVIMDDDTGRRMTVLDSCTVYCMCSFDDSHLLASTSLGLYSLDLTGYQVRRLHSDLDGRQVRFISSSGNGIFWFAAGGELVSAALGISSGGDISIGSVNAYPMVSHVIEFIHSGGILWVASLKGLFRYDIRRGECIRRGPEHGLPSAVIRGMEMGCDGNLWLATEGNIVKYDIRGDEFYVYGPKDGIQGVRFNTRVHCSTSDGRLYFGSTRGITAFRPGMSGGGRTGGRPPVISGPSSLKFRHRADVLKFTFSCPEFISAGKPGLEYMLSGIDASWTADDSGSAIYHNIPCGEYVFRLRLKSDRSRESSVSVLISPAWYESRAFLSVLAVLLICVPALTVVRVRKRNARNIEMVKAEAESKLERERKVLMEDVWRFRVEKIIGDGTGISEKDMEFMLTVFRTLWDNIARDDYSVNELASDLCMTRTNLYLKIKKATGLQAVDMIRKVRIQRAAELMSKGNRSISDVAFATGFSSATYFATCFKQVTGQTPTEWLARLK